MRNRIFHPRAMLHNKFNGFLDKSRATIYKKNKIKSGLVQRDKPNKEAKKMVETFCTTIKCFGFDKLLDRSSIS